MKCPYCKSIIAEKTMRKHLTRNEFACAETHEQLMDGCATMSSAFESKMDKVANIMLNLRKGAKTK